METRLSGSREPQSVRIRVVSVPQAKPLTLLFLGPYGGLFTHWARSQTVACLGESLCPPAIHRGRAIWKGYCPAEFWDAALELWIPCVFELTESMEHLLAGRRIRGEVWTCSRDGNRKTGTVQGLYSEKFDEEDLRAAFDVLPILESVFHTSGLELTATNPVPAAVLSQPRSARAPQIAARFTSRPEAEQQPSEEQKAKIREQIRSFSRNGGGGNHGCS
jgi:hypothetical protein